MRNMLTNCTSFNQNDIYIHAKFSDVSSMYESFRNTSRIGNVHIPASVPKTTSNAMYNCLVNEYTGKTFAAANIKNDL
jgi:hypothetical protein